MQLHLSTLLRWLQMRTAVQALILCAVLCTAISLKSRYLAQLLSYDDAGYPDSYVLYNARRVLSGAAIYNPPGTDPVEPFVYGPATTLVFALGLNFSQKTAPFVIVRLFLLLGCLGCAALAASLAAKALRNRWAGLWAFSLGLLLPRQDEFLFRVRGDFFAVLLGLLCIRLLLSRRKGATALAGLAGGLAPLFKISYVSALAAASFYLLLKDRSRFLTFVGSALLVVVGSHCILLVKEPHFIDHYRVYAANSVLTMTDWLFITRRAFAQPAILAAVLSILAFPRSVTRKHGLVLFYGTSAAVFGAIQLLQVGGDINYYTESLFAFAAVGAIAPALWLGRISRKWRPAACLSASIVMASLLVHLFAYRLPRIRSSLQRVRIGDAAIVGLEALARDRHVLSFVPRLALFDDKAALTELFILGSISQNNPALLNRIAARISAREFEAVFLPRDYTSRSHRGQLVVPRRLAELVLKHYVPQCRSPVALVFLRPAGIDRTAISRYLQGDICPDQPGNGQMGKAQPMRLR